MLIDKSSSVSDVVGGFLRVIWMLRSFIEVLNGQLVKNVTSLNFVSIFCSMYNLAAKQQSCWACTPEFCISRY